MKYQVGQLIKWRHTAGTDYGLIVAIEWLDNLCHDGMHLGQVKEVGVWILWADGLHYIKCAPDNLSLIHI